MSSKITSVLGLASILLLTQMSPARADDPTETDPQPYRCADSVVTKVGTYFEKDPNSGYYAIFKTKLGVEQFSESSAAVVDRTARSNSALAQQKVNDKVQVCLIYSAPKSQYCDPDKDSRGRIYRVYNYRIRKAYTGWNANHFCGGA